MTLQIKKIIIVVGLAIATSMQASAATAASAADSDSVPPDHMQAIYNEVKTPYKYGVVLEPPKGKLLDCPNVFRHGDKWYMVYVQFEPKPAQGYNTQLAVSDDLLHWKPLGTTLERGSQGAWDQANAGSGVALFDTKWGGSNTLGKFEDRYWISYLGGDKFGYEGEPLSISLASSADPTALKSWTKLPEPVLKSSDSSARPGEKGTLYKSNIIRDDSRALGAPFVMFYNAKPSTKGDENIFAAVSDDMKSWRRYGDGPVVANARPQGMKQNVITGDPQVVRMGDLWVMFYYGAFWKEGAFDTFAASTDLVHWTKWNGADLLRPSESYDTRFAHKPWLIKHDGVVYHFYCAVGGPDQHRTIALATSKDLKK